MKRSSRRRIATRRAAGRRRRAHRRVLLLSAPSGRLRRRLRARLRLPQAGAGHDRAGGRAISTSIRARSFMVGDKWIDVAAGRAAGARGHARAHRRRRGRKSERPHDGVAADAVVDNLLAAAAWILRESAEVRSLKC